MIAGEGRTTMVCLRCDNIDPMKTEMAKWASSSLARSLLAKPLQGSAADGT
jgi:hypothetical protein